MGMGKGLLELCRCWSQRTTSKIPKAAIVSSLEESSLPSTVNCQGCIDRLLKQSTVRCHGYRSMVDPVPRVALVSAVDRYQNQQSTVQGHQSIVR